MSAKPIFVELKDDKGQPMAGVKVKASGCDELTTAPNGKSMFLVDTPEVVIFVENKEAYKAPFDSVPATVTLVNSGGAWKAA